MNTNIKEMHGIKYKYFINDMMASYCIHYDKEWEPHITNFVKLYNCFYNIQNIIDVGANFGYHTLLFSREVQGNVFAFEPQIQNFELLENNIKDNQINNVVLYNVACGDINEDINMPIIEDNFNMINMGDFTPNLVSNNKFSTTKSVLLDEVDFCGPIDLIKIDVQGWEKKVLVGSENLLKKCKPVLIIEFEFFQLAKTDTTCEELFNFIRSNNYHIFYLEYHYPSDHICIHNDNLHDFRAKFGNHILPHTQDNELNNNINYGVNEKIVI
jgi:hypothetical protein